MMAIPWLHVISIKEFICVVCLALNLEIYKNIHIINKIDFVHVKIQSFKDIERTNKMYENA